ncbi:MAG TPA: WYL domain-containing protein [Nitrospiraceae bacterium]|nr:WYL domain-containing protein [Nitrospiraceae bacterium]
MGDRLKYERFLWFHGRVKNRSHPNARMLADKFELSCRTAQRDIEFMRDRLRAPLEYSCERKGYAYTDQSFELPGLMLTEENVLAVALAVRLASSVPDENMKQSLCSLLDDLLGRKDGPCLCSADIAELISVKNVEYSKVSSPYFSVIAAALLKSAPLEITYHSPHTRETTRRMILPLHLLLYMGSWHVIAWCAAKKGLRDFMLSRIGSAKPSGGRWTLPKNVPSAKQYIRKNFGIMQGVKGVPVKLRFTPSVSAWVREQVWHPTQQASTGRDGSLTLSFPVADFREIRRKILSYGADVKVLSPRALARDIQNEIKRMGKVY